ncbi:MAG: restriction system protein [Geotoga sp.]|nr:restriction system protein [Geotoga sp.]
MLVRVISKLRGDFMSRMWMIRAGENANLIEDFINKEVVAIGWNEIGDLTNVKSIQEIKNLIIKNYPEFSKGKIIMTASQIKKFKFDIKIGDYVVTYDPNRRIYHLGKINSDYQYNTKLIEFFHIRKVKWEHQIPRDKLTACAKNSLGAISTLFEINENIRGEFFNIINGKTISDGEDGKILIEDMQERAREFIKDKLILLSWEEMEELVAGLLRAMGYKTMLTERGPDRGRDIIASPDGLGLEDPRIVVEVKHRSDSVGGREIRSFLGGLRPGMKGLYVSTGGFTKDAKYEAERSNIPITLVDLELLVQLIIQYYNNFDEEAKNLIPLVRIYWPL